jgi:acetyltransferase-like isoleucine patch superfamily enzyme
MKFEILSVFSKAIWVARAICYKLFLGSYEFPGYIGAPLFIKGAKNIFIGRKVRIFPGMRAECHLNGKLFIHGDVSIGQGLHIICSSDLHIGLGCLISSNVFISDTDHTFDEIDTPVLSQKNIVRTTRIGENCFIGVGVKILPGTNLGKGCVVGANSVIKGDFADYSVIVGSPGRVIKKFDKNSSSWVSCG